jgi:phage-related protein
MGSLGEAVLDLTADASKMDAGLGEGKDKVSGALEGLKGTFGAATGTMMGMLSSQALQQIGQGALAFGKDIMNEAMLGEQGMAQLEAVIKSTGGAAGITAEKANELATSLSSMTMFEDDAIIAAESMLLTFTNIKDDVFPGALTTVLDMSQALGTDATQSAMMLGKALNDPIAGVGALRRVGVQLTDDQAAMVKALMETGDVAGAQAIILKELQVEFGGSAEAAGQTFAGSLKILENEFGNVKEELGTSLMPVFKDLIEMVKEMMPYIKDFAKWFSELSPTIKMAVVAFVGLLAALGPIIGIISAVISVGTMLGPVFAGIGTAFTALGPILAAVGAVLTGPVGLAIAAVIALVGALYYAWSTNLFGIRDVAAKIWPEVVNGWNTFISTIMTAWKSFSANFTAAWNNFSASFKAGWDSFLNAIRSVWQSNWFGIRDIVTSIINIIKGIGAAFMAAFRGDWYAFGAALRDIWNAAWNIVISVFRSCLATLVGIAKSIVSGIQAAFKIDWGAIGRAIIDGIVNGLKSGVNKVVDAAMAVAAAALKAAKGFLGIKSPSTAFGEVADWSIEGFTGGLTKGLGKVAAASKEMAGVALGGMRTGMTAGGPQIDGSLGRVMRAGQGDVNNSRATTNQVTIINPSAEPASQSVDSTLRKLSYLGVTR